MNRLRVAITGAAGNVGYALVNALGAMGEFDIVAIVRNDLAAKTLGSVNAEIRIGSITEPESSRRLFEGCDAVINCALPKGSPRHTRRQSDAILHNIANAPTVSVAVHFSSVAVYGPCVDPKENSFERPHPTSTYGLEKLRSEKIAGQLFSKRGMRYYILRLGHVYGPSQWISSDILARTSNPAFLLPFGGNIPSNAVSIAAVAEAIRRMLSDSQPRGVRNLVDAPQSTWRELFDYHTALLGRPSVASLADEQSRTSQARYFAEARAPLRTVLRAAKATLRSADFFRLTTHLAFRRLVHTPLLLLSSSGDQVTRNTYLKRKAASAVRQLGGREAPAQFLCMPAVPGTTFETIPKGEAFRAMSAELQAYLAAMSSYRWQPGDLAVNPFAPKSEMTTETEPLMPSELARTG